ncbi:MAG TPA: hypothetical protein VFH31_02805 [Pyrinomonadaceae bacterium]|nr:hypothetical protein [Pyrinomonadaceae bacterium]
MLVIRLYITALTIVYLIAVMMKCIGLLEGIVIVCPLIYLILDMRDELRDLKSLEAQISSLLR